MPASTQEPTREPRADARRNREAVIDAALQVLAADPQASMQAIAAGSGLGRTTVYRHFPSRESLLRALFERVVVESKDVTREAVAGDRQPAEVLRDLGPALVSFGNRFQFLAGLTTAGDEVIESSRAGQDDPLATYLVDQQRRGGIRSDIPMAWILMTISSLSIGAMQELRSGRLDPAAAGKLLGDALVTAFAAD